MSLSCDLHALPLSYYLMWSSEEYLASSRAHEAYDSVLSRHCIIMYVIHSTSYSFPLSSKILSQHPILERSQPVFRFHTHEKKVQKYNFVDLHHNRYV